MAPKTKTLRELADNPLPESAKFAPKLTLAPFVAAHKALYGEELESP